IESYGPGPEQERQPYEIARGLADALEQEAREQGKPPFLQASWRGDEGALIYQGIEMGGQLEDVTKAHGAGATDKTVEITYDRQGRREGDEFILGTERHYRSCTRPSARRNRLLTWYF
ncbi:MAG TPA: hypothetical protein VK983_02785, partial [Candidatus Limnocylindrales bacterium]|nr:hypothetical protein [Candidatus Limnocylindrales bacterium]